MSSALHKRRKRQPRHAVQTFVLASLLAFLMCACALTGAPDAHAQLEPSAAPAEPSATPAPDAVKQTPSFDSPVYDDAATDAVYSTTTGRELARNFVFRPVMAVIDNSAKARPQTGLMLADVVYEFPLDRSDHATRFLALFSDTIPARVGPIRDWRSYMAQTALEWDAMLITSGNPPNGDTPYQTRYETGLRRVLTNDGAAASVYYRDKTVSSEEELTLFCKASFALEQLYGDYASDIEERFVFEGGASYERGRLVKSVGLPFTSSDMEKIVFHYDQENNRFVRSEKNSKGVLTAAKTLTPVETAPGYVSQAITATNLIVQYVRVSALDTVYRSVRMTGAGPCEFFINGCHVAGSWSRPTAEDVTVYTLLDGTPVYLEPGNTWIALEPESHPVKIVYDPG